MDLKSSKDLHLTAMRGAREALEPHRPHSLCRCFEYIYLYNNINRYKTNSIENARQLAKYCLSATYHNQLGTRVGEPMAGSLFDVKMKWRNRDTEKSLIIIWIFESFNIFTNSCGLCKEIYSGHVKLSLHRSGG